MNLLEMSVLFVPALLVVLKVVGLAAALIWAAGRMVEPKGLFTAEARVRRPLPRRHLAS